jgi:hypothetical protein
MAGAPAQTPHQGLWINKRGWTPFRDQPACLNLSLQPAIGAPDTLVEALGDWKSAAWLDPERRWSFRLTRRINATLCREIRDRDHRHATDHDLRTAAHVRVAHGRHVVLALNPRAGSGWCPTARDVITAGLLRFAGTCIRQPHHARIADPSDGHSVINRHRS